MQVEIAQQQLRRNRLQVAPVIVVGETVSRDPRTARDRSQRLLILITQWPIYCQELEILIFAHRYLVRRSLAVLVDFALQHLHQLLDAVHTLSLERGFHVEGLRSGRARRAGRAAEAPKTGLKRREHVGDLLLVQRFGVEFAIQPAAPALAKNNRVSDNG